MTDAVRDALTEPVLPRPSSTVVLITDADELPLVYLVKRHASSSFGSAYAFPGGVVDDTDGNAAAHCSGISAEHAGYLLKLRDGALDYYVAAIRELFEETGVLLADRNASSLELALARIALNDQSLHWDTFVRLHDVKLRCDQLHYFAHWVTPVVRSKRYTTRFFVAELPSGQIAKFDAGELTDGVWITAVDALAAADTGSMILHFPTRRTLQAVARYTTAHELTTWANRCAESGVEAILPVIPADGGEPYIDVLAKTDGVSS